MCSGETVRRVEIIALARQWLGTPYHHQASLRGHGADCIGLVRGVWRELYGREPQVLPGYGRDWAEAKGHETLLEAASRHFDMVPVEALQPGDLVVFRYRQGFVAKHAGILTGTFADQRVSPTTPAAKCPERLTFIHAIEGACACEVPLNGWWRRRIAGGFQFPGVCD